MSDGSPVRDEDAFDVEALAQWLRDNASGEPGLDGVPEVRQFTGGASNLTYLLRYAGRDLILRRPPSGTKAKGAHDMRRESDIQASLGRVLDTVPRIVAYCGDESVIGSEFYVMERIDGTILRRDIPDSLGMTSEDVNLLCRNALDTLVALHSVDVEAAGLGHLSRGPGYVERQVSGWSARLRKARTPDVGSFDSTMAWLAEHQPDDVAQVLIHNDFRFDNLVLDPADPTRVVGILDWEMATVGDPLMDLGGAMAYWIEADSDPVAKRLRLQPTHERGMLGRVEAVRYYCAAMGIEMDARRWAFYEVFGLFRLAVIAQQIYLRSYRGETHNPKAKQMRWLVRYLDLRCRWLIARYRWQERRAGSRAKGGR
ncbi:aminoglycoside phosphotransferase (APT) family kinase protein [Knoellia remsis]|uniref:Aminoglycoside phosphotransferase (APT) family kinase protein n=1 Tax=Knoellia remsis TaxID=407159 RepID=A0A2T0UGM0_9MICO|nr:phosphotransferase family protein [Knoellia remsis]PRY57008.1 aminoglycoside phosphotransferase (APT) family kinase protein [Knoellia remsis]